MSKHYRTDNGGRIVSVERLDDPAQDRSDAREDMLERNRNAYKTDDVNERDAALREAIPDDAKARRDVFNALAYRLDGMSLEEFRREVVLAAVRRRGRR